MGENSAIGWTHHTFNPWWGCIRVSPGCEHCYAETFDKRVGGAHWGPAQTTERRFFGQKHWDEPYKWNKAAAEARQRHRVFCASMADVFEDNSALTDERSRLWQVIEDNWALDWLLLTKRPENVLRMVPDTWAQRFPFNVWIGTTVESQEYADSRTTELLKVPAAVRFLSCEPLLGPLDLRAYLAEQPCDDGGGADCQTCRGIQWVIGGGESGAGFRVPDGEWFRVLRDQCEFADVPFFFKQWGGRTPKANGRLLDGRTWDEFPQSAMEAR